MLTPSFDRLISWALLSFASSKAACSILSIPQGLTQTLEGVLSEETLTDFLLPPRLLRVRYLITYDQSNTPFLEDSNMKAECLIGNDEDGRRHSGSTLVHESFYNRKGVKEKILEYLKKKKV